MMCFINPQFDFAGKPATLLCFFLLTHVALFALPRSSNFPADAVGLANAHTQQLYALDLRCGANSSSLDILRPMPRAAPSSCAPLGALEALSRGARPSRDAPFELARGCALRWYTPSEACSLLARAGTLVIVGDSLPRHLTQALFAVLSGDYANGATVDAALTTPECAALCACDGQFRDSDTESGCAVGACPRSASAAFLGSPGQRYNEAYTQALKCPAWVRAHVHFSFSVWARSGGHDEGSAWTFQPQLWEASLEPLLAAAAAEAAPRPPRVTLLMTPPAGHLGLGDMLGTEGGVWGLAEKDFLTPALEFVGKAPRRRLLCGGQAARQKDTIPAAYLPTIPRYAPFNAQLRAACQGLAGRMYAGFFDPYALTVNASSHDGTHYSRELNIAAAQVLLNAIEEDFKAAP